MWPKEARAKNQKQHDHSKNTFFPNTSKYFQLWKKSSWLIKRRKHIQSKDYKRKTTLSSGISLAFCIFKSIMKLLISAKVPLALRDSGNSPWYLPDIISGLPDERSGIRSGNSCKYRKWRIWCQGCATTKIDK